VQLSLAELAALVGGLFAEAPDPALQVSNFANVREARRGDVTFYCNPKYLAALKKCEATVALVPVDFNEPVPPVCLRVPDPARAFTEIVTKFAPAPVEYAPGVHPTAVLGEGVELGEGVSVQPYAVIENGVKIGAHTVIGAHGFVGQGASIGEHCKLSARVTVGERCRVGNRVIIHSGTVLGSDGFGFELVDGRHQKVPQIGIVQVDDDVEIGANCTIDRARFGRTWIQQGSKLDNLIQVAHNVQVGEHCIIVAQAGISGSTCLGAHVILGGQVGVVGHIEIESGAIVAAQSGVSKSLRKGVYSGYPATLLEEWREAVALVRRLPKLVDRVARLEQEVGSRAISSPSES
jgi:UDP-3-O-[3-hydroxymyristoyl] glucosamine N-acyltransferase